MPFRATASSGERAELRRLRQQLAQVTMERDVLKSTRHLLAAVHEVKFRVIKELAGRYPVAPMCWLQQVSRGGFYA